MSIRLKDGKWIVEIYDPISKKKQHVRPAEFGVEPPRNERAARRLERLALNERDERRPRTKEETCDSFCERWSSDFRRRRGESTRHHNHERVQGFGQRYESQSLRSVTREQALGWAQDHPGTVPALRAMFNDALDAKLVDENPFARLGLAQSKGRVDITVLTVDELSRLRQIAREYFGKPFGLEIDALIAWSAYTCCRPGEAYAARYSLLEGDVYHLQAQYNSKLHRETTPKHGAVGAIYVPEPAREAVLSKPRRLGDDLMFRSKRGKQLRQETLNRIWSPIRAAFMTTLPPGHHLRQRLAIDPEDQLDFYELRHFGASYMLNELEIEPWVIAKQLRHSDGGNLVVKLYGHPSRDRAIERMRRAFTAHPTPLREADAAEKRADATT